MPKERLPKDWNELQSLLYDIPLNPLHQRHRSNYVYRGLGDRNWGLETSLQRLGSHYPRVEGPLLRNFVKYARPAEIPSESLFFRMAVAQHHGLPTRVLDWTTSPRVALHFALSNEERFDCDGVIWCIDVVAVRRLLPFRLRQILEQEKAFVFSVEMLEDYKRLGDLDALRADGEFVLFFEPPSLDARIVNQAAMLSVTPDPGLDLREFLLRPENEDLSMRIVVPSHVKWEARDKLDQDNVMERMLFPGLDGTSRWLKRYYGSGPGRTANQGAVRPPPVK